MIRRLMAVLAVGALIGTMPAVALADSMSSGGHERMEAQRMAGEQVPTEVDTWAVNEPVETGALPEVSGDHGNSGYGTDFDLYRPDIEGSGGGGE